MKLDEAAIVEALVDAPGWILSDGKLYHEYHFPTFMKAIDFVNRVAVMAESRNHHPDIDVRYNRVRLSLVTHDAGGITEQDVEMAVQICRELGEPDSTS